MPSTLNQVQAQTLRHLIREYIECVVGIVPGDCEALGRSISSIVESMSEQLAGDALNIVNDGAYTVSQ